MRIMVRLKELDLQSPLIAASGLFGYGDGYADLVDLSLFGAIVTKTITLSARSGNPPPRLVDVGFGMINSIGLENIGIDRFLDEVLPTLELRTHLFVSIGGSEVEEYGEVARRLDSAGRIDALEVNISCPNVSRGGIAFGSSEDLTGEVISTVRRQTRLPIIAKLPPLLVGIERIVEAAASAGADALTIANTYPAMAIDVAERRPSLGGITGGLSGKSIKPMTLRLVWKAFEVSSVPVIASGGIEEATDCIEYILAGASAFQIGSVVLRDLDSPRRILDGLKQYLGEHACENLSELVGKAHEKEEWSGQ